MKLSRLLSSVESLYNNGHALGVSNDLTIVVKIVHLVQSPYGNEVGRAILRPGVDEAVAVEELGKVPLAWTSPRSVAFLKSRHDQHALRNSLMPVLDWSEIHYRRSFGLISASTAAACWVLNC
jgi:hypothetical protein